MAKPYSDTTAKTDEAETFSADAPRAARKTGGRSGKGKGVVERLRPLPSRPAALEGDDWLGAKLREVYDDVVREPLPDDFEQLLKKLDDASSDSGKLN